jgi:VCBS repeat-containing protein
MTFFINDQSTGGNAPKVKVVITQNADGSVTIRIEQIVATGNYLGDLRGFFFDLADESIIPSLTVTSSSKTLADGTVVAGPASSTSGNDSVKFAGSSSNNMNGLLGSDGGFDFGIEIGSEGVGKNGDDVRAFEFTLDNSSRDLTLADFAGVNFGLRITSIGLDTDGDGVIDTNRNGSIKMLESGVATTGENARVQLDDDVFGGNVGGDGDGPDSSNAAGLLAHSYASGSIALTGIQVPADLGLTTVVTSTLITVYQDGEPVLEIKLINPTTGAYSVTQLGPINHSPGVGGSNFENDLEIVVGYTATSSDGDTADGILSITVDDDSVLIDPLGDLAGDVRENSVGDPTQLTPAQGQVAFSGADNPEATVSTAEGQVDIVFRSADGATAALPSGLDVDDIRGAFFITSGGAWTYDASSLNLESLAEGETIELVYTVIVSDSDGDESTVEVSITITGTNDAPTVDATDAAAITEAANASAQDLSDSGTVSFGDIDATDVVDITFNANGDPVWSGGAIDPGLAAQLLAGFATGATDAAAPGSTAWTYAVTGANLDFLAAGETITFSYTVTATDSQGASATDIVTFTITGTNDAPTVEVDATTIYNLGGSPAVVDPTITIGDVDSGTLQGATVQITGNFQAGDVLNFVAQSGITGSYNTATGLLTLTGSASLAQYEAALEAVTFSSSSTSSLPRAISFRVTDAQGALSTPDTATVNIAQTSMYFRIAVPGPEGQDRLGFDNFKITIGSTVYTMSNLVIVDSSDQFFVPPGSGSDDFALGSGGSSGGRFVVFRLDNAPASGAVQVTFDYTSSNNGNTANDGPIFSIGTTAATTTVIADYRSAAGWVGDLPLSAKSLSFNYSTSGSTTTVTAVSDPIILDLGEQGIRLTNSVTFDMDGDGQSQVLAWPTGEDGMLVMDLDRSGTIESGSEVFSPWFNNGDFPHALAALASLDENGDGQLDWRDSAYAEIDVWIDANGDGITDEGELQSLKSLGISSIGLEADETRGLIDGQTVLATGIFNYASGLKGQFAAVELTETSQTLVIAGEGAAPITGTGGNDILLAGKGGTIISAGAGDDWLFGSLANDILRGEGGNDNLMGGGGSDRLIGGLGSDVFIFQNANDSVAAVRDLIEDFSRAEGDKIDLSAFVGLEWVGELSAPDELGANQVGFIITQQGVATVIVDSNGSGSFDEADLCFDVAVAGPILPTDFYFG